MGYGLLILPMAGGGERQINKLCRNKFSSNVSLVITGYASGFSLVYCGIQVSFPTK